MWECYVAGLDPTDEDDEFVAKIEFVDGEPVVSVGGRGERDGRVYTVEGTADLLNPSWGPPDGNSRFFHVKVQVGE